MRMSTRPSPAVLLVLACALWGGATVLSKALLASIPQLKQDASKALHAIPGLPPDLYVAGPEGQRARCHLHTPAGESRRPIALERHRRNMNVGRGIPEG